MRRLAILLLVAACPAVTAGAQSAASIRETALARISRAQALVADPELVKAVREKNASKESMEDIARKDKEWVENARYLLRKELSQSACALRLRELTRDDPVIVEAILMDAQGANVCVSRETSDYWQGDEAKFQRTFGANKDVFLDEPALDASTGVYAIQLSVLLRDAGAKIGALTLSLRVPKRGVRAQ
jgi:hypothetical protein